VACFNACCRDLSQLLTPYDVLRLTRGLGLRSGEFLRRYTLCRTGPGSGLPVVSLVPGDSVGLTCPFLSPSGCRVYRDRPSSCRTYPLLRLVRRARATGLLSEEFMLLREPHCRGFESGRLRTPAEWVADQGLAPYHAENDRLLDILSLKNRLHPGPLPPQAAADTAVCLYDLDRLRDGLDPDAFAELAPDAIAAARTDDIALLHLGLERVKRHLALQGPGGAPA
jgi:Fe-S-cluster containining protein